MNQQAFEAGREAYRQGDLNAAVTYLGQAKQPGEVSGRIDHLLGNCLMKLGKFDQAAVAYGDALNDPNYGHAGALAANRGRALLAAGRPQEAVASLVMATRDQSYPTPYKAYVALGNAYSQLGDYREAGVAYRNAAIDEANPDPSGALRSLGGCFMKMGRAVDAVEAYRTALDFATPLENQNAIYEDLGMAYAAAGRWDEAVDSFGHATASGTHLLSPESQAALASAKAAINSVSSRQPSSTDAFLAAAGYGSGYATGTDPLDPLGKSGEFMPSPEDTGFFDITEKEMARLDVDGRSIRRKHRGSGLRGCLTFILIVLLLAGGAAYAFYNGYGWPMQETVVEELFTTNAAGADISSLLADSLSEEARAEIKAILPDGATGVTVKGVDRSMSESQAFATATLSAGGEQSYEISLVRDGIGWKVASVSVSYPANEGQTPAFYDPNATTEDASAEGEAAAAEGEATTEGSSDTTTTTGTV